MVPPLKVKSYSAAWLANGTPGHQLFEASTDSLAHRGLSRAGSNKKDAAPGPRRTIAKRGTEVFVAAGKDIRWGDLAYVKEQWAAGASRGRSGPGGVRIKREDTLQSMQSIEDSVEDSPAGIRTLKTKCAEDIRQLIISPNGNNLAILTTHTVHIMILPDSSHLTSQDTEPLKPKIHTLGPTTHVTSRSAIMSAIWHPLGVNGSCLVTVTADAVVRLWELAPQHRWSFDSPTTSIDLKKLADGTTLDQDFTATQAATNKGFSPDSFEMDVAAASFAHGGAGGWNPMTLWVAMREGDVYALCPLLPQKWSPPPTLIPSLSVSIVQTVGEIEDDPEVSEFDKLLAQQQLEWMGDLDSQEPQIVEGQPGESFIEVYTRPSRPGVTPRLQGPFELTSDPETGDDLDTSITDIMVIGKKTDAEDLMMGEDEDLVMEGKDNEGASIPVVCLLSTSGQVRVYLDLEGVQAQWLPPKSKSKMGRLLADVDDPSLLAFQAIDTMSPVEVSEDSWPVFSEDLRSRYDFFVTHHAGIVYISLSSWIFRLENELNGDSEAGTDFRIGLVVNSQSSRDRIFSQATTEQAVPLAAATGIYDPDLKYLLLSATPHDPVALTFDAPELDAIPIRDESPVFEREASKPLLEFYEPRPVFNPSHVFDEKSVLPQFVDRLRTSRYKTVLNQEVRLSPMTLGIFTDAHKVLSDETYKLGVAAAEVFRRCELLQTELQEQIRKAHEVKLKVDNIAFDSETGVSDRVGYDQRAKKAEDRQRALTERLDELRKTVNRSTARDLSAKERAWFQEVQSVETNITLPERPATEESSQAAPLWQRLDNATKLQKELLSEVESLKKQGEVDVTSSPSARELRIPQDIRRSKLHQVQGLLSRETALVEAVTERLERLQTQTAAS